MKTTLACTILLLALSSIATSRILQKVVPKTFQRCKIPFWKKYSKIPLDDTGKHIVMMRDIVPGWKDVDRYTIDNLSGAGGAALYMFKPVDTTVKPWGAVLKLTSPKRRIQAVVPQTEDIIERRTNDAICALQRNGEITLEKMAEGDNWFVQQAMGVETSDWKHRYEPELIGKLSARIHSTPKLWAKSYQDILEKKFPAELKDQPKGSAVWSFAKYALNSPEATGYFPYLSKLEKMIQYQQNDPKKSYTVHGDWHGYNMMYTDNTHKDMRAIDIDETWVSNPLVDLSRHMWLEGIGFAKRQTLVKAWIKGMGWKDSNGEKLVGWLLDAEVYKLLNNIDGVFVQRIGKCEMSQPKRSSDEPAPMDGLVSLIRLWNAATKSPVARLQVITLGLMEYANTVVSQTEGDGKIWAAFRNSECGQTIPAIQLGFRVKHTVGNNNMYVNGKAEDIALLLSDFQKVPLSFPGFSHKRNEAFEGWTVLKKGDEQNPFYAKDTVHYRGESNTFLVSGGTRKSGYPYANWYGNLIFKTEQIADNHVWIHSSLNRWRVMGLQYPEAGALQWIDGIQGTVAQYFIKNKVTVMDETAPAKKN